MCVVCALMAVEECSVTSQLLAHMLPILTPFPSSDSGLVVPSVPYELHKSLLAAAEHQGLSLERRLETIGVCSSQMALTLLGGPNR